jgi:hypothetical protein
MFLDISPKVQKVDTRVQQTERKKAKKAKKKQKNEPEESKERERDRYFWKPHFFF